MAPGPIRAVAFQEGDVWVVHGVEYDLVAQAKDPFEAPLAFWRTVVSTLLINKKLGRSGLDGVKRAPARFEKMWESAKATLEPTELPTPDDFPRPQIDMRGYSPAP